MLTEHRLPGVRLPLDGRSLPSYSLHCNAGAAVAALKQALTRTRKNKVMTIATQKTPSPASNSQRALNSIQNVIAKAARLNPLKTGKAAPSWEAIGEKAYEIWMLRGQQQGHDQEHWFEAERQLAGLKAGGRDVEAR
jgi:hypothetical protein